MQASSPFRCLYGFVLFGCIVFGTACSTDQYDPDIQDEAKRSGKTEADYPTHWYNMAAALPSASFADMDDGVLKSKKAERPSEEILEGVLKGYQEERPRGKQMVESPQGLPRVQAMTRAGRYRAAFQYMEQNLGAN